MADVADVADGRDVAAGAESADGPDSAGSPDVAGRGYGATESKPANPLGSCRPKLPCSKIP